MCTMHNYNNLYKGIMEALSVVMDPMKKSLGTTEAIGRAAGRSGHMAWHLRDSSRLDPSRARPSEAFRGLLPRAQPGVMILPL